MQKKPNVLFIVTDDQRFDTIRALGNSEIITPNLDRLAQRGTAFVRAHIAGGTCGAVCMPSRAMILSGRNPFHLEELGGNIPPEHKTLAETFKNNGYETIGLGKWHNGCPAYARSFTQGAKIFFGGMWDHWNVPTCRYAPTGEYDNVINFVVDFYSDNHPQPQHCDEFDPGKHSSTLLTDAAIELLNENVNKDKPFFMYLAYLAPHDPRTMPDSFREMYDPEKIKLPPNFQQIIDTNYPLMVHRDEHLAAYPREEQEIKRHIAEYFAMITHLDYEIGRLLDTLHQSGEEDNTIIVFTGDNGLAVGQHGWLGKEDIYEHGVRVPLIMAGPGIAQNARNDAYVYLYDIFPTLCEKVGIDIPPSVDGKSFAYLLDGNHGETFRDELYLIFDKFVRGVKDDNYKLIEYRNGDKDEDKWTFLYDIKNDPWETVNLAQNDEYKDKVSEMREKILKHRDEWEEQTHPWGIEFWGRFNNSNIISNEENQCEFTPLPVGHMIRLGRGESPSGAYGTQEGYMLEILENGYLVKWFAGGPMTGLFEDSWELPIGFFADLSNEQVRSYFFDNRGYYSEQLFNIDEQDINTLVRTDRWKLDKILNK